MNNGFVESLSQIFTIHSRRWTFIDYFLVWMVITDTVLIIPRPSSKSAEFCPPQITLAISWVIWSPEAHVMKIFGMKVFHWMLYTGVLCAWIQVNHVYLNSCNRRGAGEVYLGKYWVVSYLPDTCWDILTSTGWCKGTPSPRQSPPDYMHNWIESSWCLEKVKYSTMR